jgi:hypothetical protein
MQRLEVATDRDRFRDVGAVVELEHGQSAHDVHVREELLCAVLAGHDVDLLPRDVDPLLRQEDVDASWIRCTRERVELHAPLVSRRAET